ncbi:MAG TPA: YceI family protein [Polyangiaceae bacterium]|jgi:polyisoprenoid-binding protein YceI|nr:YceI family protein [Polyangiaceae bacterium]
MKRRKWLWTAPVAFGLFTLSVVGHAALSSASDAHVSFQASGPAGMKIEGTTSEMSVVDDGANVVVTVPLANLSTGIGLRDHHMKEKYLEVPKYPAATLTLARGVLKFPATGGEASGDVPATVTLHGQSKPVTVHYDAKGAGPGLDAHGTFRVNMNDFGISIPSYLGVTVKPDVDVSASFHVAGS